MFWFSPPENCLCRLFGLTAVVLHISALILLLMMCGISLDYFDLWGRFDTILGETFLHILSLTGHSEHSSLNILHLVRKYVVICFLVQINMTGCQICADLQDWACLRALKYHLIDVTTTEQIWILHGTAECLWSSQTDSTLFNKVKVVHTLIHSFILLLSLIFHFRAKIL